jgi:hypothetical protein
MFQKSLDDYFYGLLSDEEMTPIYVEDDIEKMEFLDLLSLIKGDFDKEIYPEVNANVNIPELKAYLNIPEDVKKSEEVALRKHYLKLVDNSKKELDFAINHIAEIDETAYKIDKNKTLAKFKDIKKVFENAKIGYNQKRWYLIRNILYLGCLLSFMIAVSILCVSIIMML